MISLVITFREISMGFYKVSLGHSVTVIIE
jgi:hypothetical protein